MVSPGASLRRVLPFVPQHLDAAGKNVHRGNIVRIGREFVTVAAMFLTTPPKRMMKPSWSVQDGSPLSLYRDQVSVGMVNVGTRG